MREVKIEELRVCRAEMIPILQRYGAWAVLTVMAGQVMIDADLDQAKRDAIGKELLALIDKWQRDIFGSKVIDR